MARFAGQDGVKGCQQNLSGNVTVQESYQVEQVPLEGCKWVGLYSVVV